MSITKLGKNYTVTFDDDKTIFVLHGMSIKQPKMGQLEAIKFLQLNGFDGFMADKKLEEISYQKSSQNIIDNFKKEVDLDVKKNKKKRKQVV